MVATQRLLARFPDKRRAPSRAPKERLEREARQIHAHRVSDRQKGKAVGVKEWDWSPLNVFSSLARPSEGPHQERRRNASNPKPVKVVPTK